MRQCRGGKWEGDSVRGGATGRGSGSGSGSDRGSRIVRLVVVVSGGNGGETAALHMSRRQRGYASYGNNPCRLAAAMVKYRLSSLIPPNGGGGGRCDCWCGTRVLW